MHARRWWVIFACALAGLLGIAASALAAIDCFFSGTSGVNFGAYNVFQATPTDATGSLTYNCKGVGPTAVITIDLSRGTAPTYTPRQLRKGTEGLNYNLYLDAATTTIWGDGTGGTSHYGPIHPSTNVNVTLTIYGRIPAGQNVSAGSYADTITATVNF